MHELSKKIADCLKSKIESVGIDNISPTDLEEVKGWACVIKDLTEFDKNCRVIKAMDEEEEGEGYYGYRGRADNGRFVHRTGPGRNAGYSRPYLYMEEDEWVDRSLNDPNFERNLYGYRDDERMMGGRNGNMNRTGNERMGYHSADGIPENYGKDRALISDKGVVYDRFDQYLRHYTQTHDPESKKQMEEALKAYFDEFIGNAKSMWGQAEATTRKELKDNMIKMVQQLPA